jgi:hypothetical protein
MLHSPNPYPAESVLTAMINDITLRDGGYGIWTVDGKGDYIVHNRVKGNGKPALQVGNDPIDLSSWLPDPTEANSFVSNDIVYFVPSVAHIIFWDDVIDNTLEGYSGTVLFGKGNKITGYKSGRN